MASTYWQAGWRLTAARLNSWTDRVRPKRYTSVLSAPYNPTGVWTAVPGTSQTITTTYANAEVDVFATWEYEPGSTMFGKVYIDGSETGPQSVTASKGIASLHVPATISTAGTHTIVMYVLASGSGGTLYTGGTRMLTRVYEAV